MRTPLDLEIDENCRRIRAALMCFKGIPTDVIEILIKALEGDDQDIEALFERIKSNLEKQFVKKGSGMRIPLYIEVSDQEPQICGNNCPFRIDDWCGLFETDLERINSAGPETFRTSQCWEIDEDQEN